MYFNMCTCIFTCVHVLLNHLYIHFYMCKCILTYVHVFLFGCVLQSGVPRESFACLCIITHACIHLRVYASSHMHVYMKKFVSYLAGRIAANHGSSRDSVEVHVLGRVSGTLIGRPKCKMKCLCVGVCTSRYSCNVDNVDADMYSGGSCVYNVSGALVGAQSV
jgi:hypothetical protein